MSAWGPSVERVWQSWPAAPRGRQGHGHPRGAWCSQGAHQPFEKLVPAKLLPAHPPAPTLMLWGWDLPALT